MDTACHTAYGLVALILHSEIVCANPNERHGPQMETGAIDWSSMWTS
jgi:hypothetical protein